MARAAPYIAMNGSLQTQLRASYGYCRLFELTAPLRIGRKQPVVARGVKEREEVFVTKKRIDELTLSNDASRARLSLSLGMGSGKVVKLAYFDD